MTQSILEICEEALNGVGVDPPSSLTTGDLGRRLLGIANAVGQSVATRYDWQELKTEGTFTTTASQELQMTWDDDFPNARKFLDDTFWNRTTQRRLFRMTDQAWQRIKAYGPSPATEVYYWQGRKLLMDSDTVVGSQTIAFEYIDKRWAVESDGTTYARRFVNNTDMPRLDDHIFVLGVRWRYLQSLGLEYGEHFREYEDYVYQKQAEDQPLEKLSMNPYNSGEEFVRQVPDGSWNL